MMQPERLAPSAGKRHGRGIFGGQRQPAAATFRRWPDLGDIHDGLPQAVGIDRRVHAAAASFITVARIV